MAPRIPASGVGSGASLAEPNDVWHQRLAARLDYPVVFTRDVLAPGNPALVWAIARREPERSHRALAVIDAGLARAWPDVCERLRAYADAHRARIRWAGEPLVIPGGEAVKNDPEIVARLHARLFAEHLDRHACVVVLGGGAVLDVVGYAAATAHRGLRVVRLPSTVLAQNDAGIGVKNGINAFGVKNFLGTFASPWAVVDDFDWVETLSARDRIAGAAEAVKVALIRDAEFFAWLEDQAEALARCDRDATETMIRRCAELHLEHIRSSGDPFETGSARPLDFGHWAAHKLEALSAHALRHGEAVAIGIALDTRYSVLRGLLNAVDGQRVHALLGRLGLPRWHDALARMGSDGRLMVLGGLDDFREHLGGELTITVLEAIGHGVEIHAVAEDLVGDALAWLRAQES